MSDPSSRDRRHARGRQAASRAGIPRTDRLDMVRPVCEYGATAERGRVAAPQTRAPIGGRQVQRTMRRFTRMAIAGAIAAFVAVPLFATSASAVDAAAAVCTFNVLPNPVPAGGTIHIEGTAPPLSTVSAFNVTNPGT